MVTKTKKKKNRSQLLAQGKDVWPKTVMGVKVKNQKEMDKLINSVRGVSPWNKRGSLGS